MSTLFFQLWKGPKERGRERDTETASAFENRVEEKLNCGIESRGGDGIAGGGRGRGRGGGSWGGREEQQHILARVPRGEVGPPEAAQAEGMRRLDHRPQRLRQRNLILSFSFFLY